MSTKKNETTAPKGTDLHPPKDSLGHEDDAGAAQPTEDQIAKVNATPTPDVAQPDELGGGDDVAPIGAILQDIPADEGPDGASKYDPSNLQVVVSDE